MDEYDVRNTVTARQPSDLPGEHFTLVVVTGPDSGTSCRLTIGVHTIGSSPQCDIQLNDTQISRRHLELTVFPNAVRVRDLDSKNGSFLLGNRFEGITVRSGATVRIGQSKLRLFGSGGEQLAPYEGDHFGPLFGQSAAMRQVFALLSRLAESDIPVLVTGETGTGKDVAAHALHAASSRGERPLLVIDLAGMTETLAESELFGHVRGAFTGAVDHRVGAFEQAAGSSVFLDEIGEMPLAVQPRLLRVLEARRIKPIGAGQYRDVDVRFIAATHRDLGLLAEKGQFRADLYHRLAVATVHMPPLRERREDIPGLIHAIIDGLRDRDLRQRSLIIRDDVMTALCGLSWPGNVRQLRNVLERAYSLVGTDRVAGPALLGLQPDPSLAKPPGDQSDGDDSAQDDSAQDDRDGDNSDMDHNAEVVPVDIRVPFKEAKERLIQTWEREYLSQLLAKHDGHVSRAASDAGIDRVHLHRLLKRHGFVKRYR